MRLVLLFLALACGDKDGTVPTDGGGGDGGTGDGGGTSDGGGTGDGGGSSDGGTSDGGGTGDGGTSDGGTGDGGTGDGGTGDGGTTAEPPPIGLWVWDTTIPGDDVATSRLLTFAEEKGVGTLFMACDPVGYHLDGAEARYVDFVDQAHTAGLQVFAMSGYGWFTVPCDADLPGQPTCYDEGWGVYQACAGSKVPFDGIMDDSEPFSVASDTLTTAYQQRVEWHLAWLQGIRDRIGDLPLHHAIPAWYDTREALDLEGTGSPRTFDAWIADLVDGVAVMAYRDDAGLVLDLSATELARGPAWVVVECGAHHLSQVTFYDDGEPAMLSAFDEIEAAVGTDPNFLGIAVDQYDAWSDLAGR